MTDDLLTFRSFGSKKCSILRGDTQRFTCRMSRQSAAKKTHLALVINLLTLVLTQAGSFAKWSFVPCLSCKCPMLIYLHTHIYTQTHTHTHAYIYKYIYIQLYIYAVIFIYIYIYIYGVVHTVHLCINSWVWQTMTMDLWGRKKTISSSLLLEGHQRCANLTVIVVHSDQHLIQQLGLRSLQGWGMDKQWQKPDCQMEILSFSTKEA